LKKKDLQIDLHPRVELKFFFSDLFEEVGFKKKADMTFLVIGMTFKKKKMNFYLNTKIVVKNPCTKTTCQNGGTCYSDILSNAQCFCLSSFEGKFCEIDKIPTATTTTTTKATTASSSKLNSVHS